MCRASGGPGGEGGERREERGQENAELILLCPAQRITQLVFGVDNVHGMAGASNVRWEGVHFAFGTWLDASGPKGYIDTQSVRCCNLLDPYPPYARSLYEKWSDDFTKTSSGQLDETACMKRGGRFRFRVADRATSAKRWRTARKASRRRTLPSPTPRISPSSGALTCTACRLCPCLGLSTQACV